MAATLSRAEKKALREEAQGDLLDGMQCAFARLDDDVQQGITSAQKAAALRDEMSKQMARVERLFGYIPYSFARGV